MVLTAPCRRLIARGDRPPSRLVVNFWATYIHWIGFCWISSHDEVASYLYFNQSRRDLRKPYSCSSPILSPIIVQSLMAAVFHQYCRVDSSLFFSSNSPNWHFPAHKFLSQCWTRTMCLTRSRWGQATGTPWSARNMSEKSYRFDKFYHL